MPEFGPSCRDGGNSVRYTAEDVMVEVVGARRRIGGNVKKCMAGLRGLS